MNCIQIFWLIVVGFWVALPWICDYDDGDHFDER